MCGQTPQLNFPHTNGCDPTQGKELRSFNPNDQAASGARNEWLARGLG